MYIQIDPHGRIVAVSAEQVSGADIRVQDMPDGFLPEHGTEWLYAEGTWTHRPERETNGSVSLEERIEQTELALMELAAMIGGMG